ncbi:MAG: extracellular solute-binding protein [Actinomycetaceae bacterium]|nr:extracellular solute-binding protein [Actinomycetaceae bacterium]
MSRRTILMSTITVASLFLAACGGSGFDGGESGADSTAASSEEGSVNVLIAASGDAEAKAVKDAVQVWSDDTGTPATVDVASDLVQQLAQGFAGGTPPDVFYTSSDQFVGYAQNGSLEPYGDDLSNKSDFYDSLRDAFTYDNKLYCAPKDFSTLALVINRQMWQDAGLTEADYPTTWSELDEIARKLTNDDHVGLSFGPEYQRIGVFFAQAGGGLERDGKAIVNAPENTEALNQVISMMNDGSLKLSNQIGAGWGGEAFGKQLAAMVIEGNWITGALKNDFPDLEYDVVPLPAGPAGKGTLQYTNCWGIASDSKSKDSARNLVEFLTSTEQQMKFADAFGVMPSVKSAADEWKEKNPTMVAFLEGADYAQYLPTRPGTTDVISDLNAKFEQLPNLDVQTTLDQAQLDLEAVLND